MKRTLLAILALLMAALLAIPAFAENAVVNTIELTNCYVYLDYQSGRLVVENYDTKTYVLMDSYGNTLTPKSYANMSARSGMFMVESNEGVNDRGLVDSDGVEVIPLQYSNIIIVSNRWQIGEYLVDATVDNYDYKSNRGDAFYRVDHYDVYFRGTMVGTLTRTDYDHAHAYGDYLYLKSKDGKISFYNKDFVASGYQGNYYSGEYDTTYSGGKTTYWHKGSNQQAFVEGCTLTEDEVQTAIIESSSRFYDLQGNLLFTAPNPYDDIDSFRGDYARVKWDGKYGLIDKQGNEVVPCEYDSIDCSEVFLGAGYQIAVKDGKVGFFDVNGNETCEFKYSSAIASSTYYSPFTSLTDPEGNTIVLTGAVGELPERYSGSLLPSGDICPVFKAMNGDGVAGIVDVNGTVLVPFAYDNLYALSFSKDGTVVVGSKGIRSYTVYTLSYDLPQPGDALIERLQARVAELKAELDAVQTRIAELEAASADENP